MAPVSVKVPVPTFVKPPVPERTPEKVVEVLLPPAVRVPAPRVTLPAPASEPTVSGKPARSKVAPKLTLRAVMLASMLAFTPATRVPADMVVGPV